MIERPFLLDVTRLISRSWTRRLSTGIDRVCYAYLEHFRARAHAVVQHRGLFCVLTGRHSDRLFEMLSGSDARFRRELTTFAPRALASGTSEVDGDGAIYINVSHTDFDLSSHTRWIESCRLRPTYLIHDLIPITHSEFCKAHAVKRHRGRVINALRTAAGIIVNSETTARALKTFSRQQGLPMPPTLAALLAGTKLTKPSMASADPAPYFVCVGTIEGRKNHVMLLRLWRRLIEQAGAGAPRLVIIGQWGVNAGPVRTLLESCAALRNHVTVVPQCTDERLGRWLVGARALLLPTLAEGFGLPLVEALNLGTPVIASDLPCFREIGQGIPTLLDPLDEMAWERMIHCFGQDHPERNRQLELMPGYRPSTWANHFSNVETWFETLPQLSQDRPVAGETADDWALASFS